MKWYQFNLPNKVLNAFSAEQFDEMGTKKQPQTWETASQPAYQTSAAEILRQKRVMEMQKLFDVLLTGLISLVWGQACAGPCLRFINIY